MNVRRILGCCVLGNALLAGTACTESVAEEDVAGNDGQADALASTNGLAAINGLTAINGLSAINGLVSGSPIMSTAEGRNTVSYIVRCALPAGRSITKQDQNGTSYTFPGQIGVAPQWETNGCGTDCQQYVSACLMAHVNTTGQHIAIWMVGDASPLGWGTSSSYPYQEGSFFGNIFTSPPSANYCEGEDFDLGVVPGRLGATQSGAPYKDPFGTNALCSKYCTAQSGGYSKCGSFPHVVTVYRDWDPNTNYKVCSRKSNLCMTVDNGGTADGTRITQTSYSGSSNQKFRITAVSAGQYKICSASSGKCVKPTSTSGAQLQIYSYSGSSNQKWSITPHDGAYGYYFTCSLSDGRCLEVNDTSTTGIVNDTFHNITAQEWSVGLAN